jgi:hypothetical protein
MRLEKLSGDFHTLPHYHLHRRFSPPLISFGLGRLENCRTLQELAGQFEGRRQKDE